MGRPIPKMCSLYFLLYLHNIFDRVLSGVWRPFLQDGFVGPPTVALIHCIVLPTLITPGQTLTKNKHLTSPRVKVRLVTSRCDCSRYRKNREDAHLEPGRVTARRTARRSSGRGGQGCCPMAAAESVSSVRRMRLCRGGQDDRKRLRSCSCCKLPLTVVFPGGASLSVRDSPHCVFNSCLRAGSDGNSFRVC